MEALNENLILSLNLNRPLVQDIICKYIEDSYKIVFYG